MGAKLRAECAAGQKFEGKKKNQVEVRAGLVCKSSRRMDAAAVVAALVVACTIPYRDNGVNEPHTSSTAHSILLLCVRVSVRTLVRGCISRREGLLLLVFLLGFVVTHLRF